MAKDVLTPDEVKALRSKKAPDVLSAEQVEKLRSKSATPEKPEFENGLPTGIGSSFDPVALAQGAAQGASLGYADEAEAAIRALAPDVDYETARKMVRERYKKSEEESPKQFMAGQVGGSLATLAVPGLAPLKGASAVKSLGQAAAIGGASGLGLSEAEDAAGLLKDAGIGAATGAAFQGLSLGLDKSKAVKDYMRKQAEMSAGKALGAERGSLKKLAGSYDPKKMEAMQRAMGRRAIDEKIISLFGNAETMAERNKIAMDLAMEGRQGVYDALEAIDAGVVDPEKLIGRLQTELGKFSSKSPLNAAKQKKIEDIIEAINLRSADAMAKGQTKIGAQAGQELVEEIQGAAKYTGIRPSEAEELARKAGMIAREELNEGTQFAAEKALIPGAEKIPSQNRSYALGAKTEELLGNRFARESGNKVPSLTDTIAVSGGIGGQLAPQNIAATVGIKKGLEAYGRNFVALGADKIADILEREPGRLGKFAKPLLQAASRGPAAFLTMHHILSGNPEYSGIYEQSP